MSPGTYYTSWLPLVNCHSLKEVHHFQISVNEMKIHHLWKPLLWKPLLHQVWAICLTDHGLLLGPSEFLVYRPNNMKVVLVSHNAIYPYIAPSLVDYLCMAKASLRAARA